MENNNRFFFILSLIVIIIVILLIFLKFNNNNIHTDNNNYIIPKIVHQTFSTNILPKEILQIMEKNKKLNPDCLFKFYDDKDCDLFIKNNFNSRIYKAYNNINPIYGAMKADFFRYCVLYVEGGVYLDIKSILIDNLFKYIKKDDVCILDIERNYLEPWRFNKPTFEQWLLIFKKNHPYLLHMINQIVFYIDNKFEPKILNFKNLNTKQKILHITGPDAFTKVIKEYIRNKKNILHRNLDYNKLAMVNNFSIFNYHKMYEINGKKHYSQYNEQLYKI